VGARYKVGAPLLLWRSLGDASPSGLVAQNLGAGPVAVPFQPRPEDGDFCATLRGSSAEFGKLHCL